MGGLLRWAVQSRFVVILLACTLALVGGYAFVHVNVEAYPDPAPAIIEVVAQYPGASAEEVERQVTVPLEIGLAGMPGLQYTRTKSMFGLAHLRNQFLYEVDFAAARQEVLNRLASVDLPEGVQPQISGRPHNMWVKGGVLWCELACCEESIVDLSSGSANGDRP